MNAFSNKKYNVIQRSIKQAQSRFNANPNQHPRVTETPSDECSGMTEMWRYV